jgi:hypothetical protein
VWTFVFTRPSEDTYRILLSDPFASTNRALVWVGLAGLISSAVTILLNLGAVRASVAGAFGDTAVSRQFLGTLVSLLCGIPFAALATMAVFAVSVGLVHFAANALGGTGEFTDLFYLFAAVSAPVSLVSSVLAAIPFVNCLNFAIGLYALYLQVLAVKTVHQLDWPRSIGSVAVLVILALLAGCLLVLLIGAPLFALAR